MTGELNLDWLISVDDHVLEPPNLWTDRVASKDRDRAPHLEHEGSTEFWVYDGKRLPTTGLSAVAGKAKEEFSPEPVTYAEMRPGCYDAKARIEDMNQAGVLASMCFPSVTRFCGQLFYEAQDHDFALTCVKAYNDWMIDDWCATAPGRFIPLVLIPLWDPQLAAKELERCAAKGATAFAFSENPAPLGLPTIHDQNGYWDPVMAAASELGMVVCMHVGSSSTIPKISPDSPFMANLTWGATRTSGAMLSWLFSGMFNRFPGVKIALSEGEIGWMPYFLERAEQVFDKQRHWVKKGVQFHPFRPREEGGNTSRHDFAEVDVDTIDLRALFREHIYGCFIEDRHGIASIDEIGEDNIMCETDYPHSDSTWPECIQVVQDQINHLTPEVQYKILRGNAERLFRFTAAEPPVLARP
jgi:predicted TIM-barrel fold metal-dependent hydrolase